MSTEGRGERPHWCRSSTSSPPKTQSPRCKAILKSSKSSSFGIAFNHGLSCFISLLRLMAWYSRLGIGSQGLLLGLGRLNLSAEELVEVAAFFEQQDDLLERAEHQA